MEDSTLPDELYYNIFSMVDWSTLKNIFCVNKYFNILYAKEVDKRIVDVDYLIKSSAQIVICVETTIVDKIEIVIDDTSIFIHPDNFKVEWVDSLLKEWFYKMKEGWIQTTKLTKEIIRVAQRESILIDHPPNYYDSVQKLTFTFDEDQNLRLTNIF